MLHAKDLDIVTAYDTYFECSEGNLGEEQKAEKPMYL